MFGLANTPTIAGRRVKVLLHLLSPTWRPLQITQDLKGFGDGSYSKHLWPDDPLKPFQPAARKINNYYGSSE